MAPQDPHAQGATDKAQRDFPLVLQACRPTGEVLLRCGSQYDPTTFFVAFAADCAGGRKTLQVGRVGRRGEARARGRSWRA